MIFPIDLLSNDGQEGKHARIGILPKTRQPKRNPISRAKPRSEGERLALKSIIFDRAEML
jgi:hypothetical protein